MSTGRLFGIASFLVSGVLLLFLVQIPSSMGWLLTGSAFYASAGVYGFVAGFVFGKSCAVAVGWGAFAAAAVLCVPVIFVTYGFALAGAPLVLAFALVVVAGANLGGRLREGTRAV